jgi:membrane-associated protease RseP (regulator of RpoE activity)
MKKALVIVGALVVIGALIVSAFAGGMVVGRMAGQDATPGVLETAVPTETESPAQNDAPLAPETALPDEDTDESPSPSEDNGEDDRADVAPDVPSSEAFNYDLLQTVLDLLDEQFYGEIPDGEELAYGAVRGMLMTLDDPYTSFIEPRIATILSEDATGEFEGIGAMVSMREDGYLEISSLIPGQPAEAAGVQPGDIIVAVNGQRFRSPSSSLN